MQLDGQGRCHPPAWPTPTAGALQPRQLEARNPTPEPNEARAALGGAWRLAYTSNSELIALLALGRLPLVEVGEISQTIDPMGQTVENRVELQAPLRCDAGRVGGQLSTWAARPAPAGPHMQQRGRCRRV